MEAEQPKSIEDTLSEEYDKLTAEEEVNEPEIDGEAEEAPEPEPEPAEEAEPEPEKEPEPEPEPEEEKYFPPTGWTAESKSKWKEVPDWLKRQIHVRDQDSIKGVTSLKEKADFGDRLSQTIQPYQPLLNSMGVTPESAVKDALNLAHSLKTGSPQEKAQLIRNIAQQYEVDLSVAGQEPSEIEKALQPYQQQIRQLQETINNQQNSTQQQQYNAAQMEVQNFAAATDEDGNLKHPYFENVRQDMQLFVEAERATSLEDAYEKACWASPEIRSILQSQQAQEIEEKRKVEKAEKANSVNIEATQSEELKSTPKGSIEETLSKEYDRLTAEG